MEIYNKRMIIVENKGITILADIENDFYIRASDIMIDFLKYNDGIEQKQLEKKYTHNELNSFYKQLEKYKRYFTYKNIIPNDIVYGDGNITSLTLNVSSSCNQKCDYCFEGNNFCNNIAYMSKAVSIKAIDLFLIQLKGKRGCVTFTGGEPLINFTIIKYVTEYIINKTEKINFVIKTNGTLLNAKILDFLIENKFFIQISLDGCKEAHECHRKYKENENSTFNKVNLVIKEIVNRNYVKNIGINAVVTHDTIKYLEKSNSYLKKLVGSGRYSIKPVMKDNSNGYELSEQDYNKYLDYIIKLDKHEVELHNEYSNCGIGISNLAIDTNGDIYPCYRLSGIEKYLLGNVFEQGFKYKLPSDLEKLYALNENEKCADCKNVSLCQTGCFSEKLLNNSISKCSCVEKDIMEHFIKKKLINTGLYKRLDII